MRTWACTKRWWELTARARPSCDGRCRWRGRSPRARRTCQPVRWGCWALSTCFETLYNFSALVSYFITSQHFCIAHETFVANLQLDVTNLWRLIIKLGTFGVNFWTFQFYSLKYFHNSHFDGSNARGEGGGGEGRGERGPFPLSSPLPFPLLPFHATVWITLLWFLTTDAKIKSFWKLPWCCF